MIWLIGAGTMAVEYAKVLDALGQEYLCITRSHSSAEFFNKQINQQVISGGLDAFLRATKLCPSHAIVATGMESLQSVTSMLMNHGVRNILTEKPAGMNLKEVNHLTKLSETTSSRIFVAYNRRFYASVIKAEELIHADGGISSINYEITEWNHVIAGLKQSSEIKARCFIANTSHVVDLAFYLAGRPEQYACFTADSTSWHPSSANFSGAGITDKKALFSYHGNWNAPGRWSLDVSTRQHRYIFRPMEQLQIQHLGSVAILPVEIDFQYDRRFKPGLYKQTEAFLSGNTAKLCSIADHRLNMELYYTMADYRKNE